MRIGLYFGTFNPIHVGHLAIANHLVEFSDIDQVWMVVTPLSPFKKKNSKGKDEKKNKDKKILKEKLTDQVVDNLVLAMKYITDTSMKEEGLYRVPGVRFAFYTCLGCCCGCCCCCRRRRHCCKWPFLVFVINLLCLWLLLLFLSYV